MAESDNWGVIEYNLASLYPTLDSVHADRRSAEGRVTELIGGMTELEIENGEWTARVIKLGTGTVREVVTVITEYSGPDGQVYSISSTIERGGDLHEFDGWGYDDGRGCMNPDCLACKNGSPCIE